MESTKIIIFKGKNIRKTIFKNEWWFSVVDVVEALTESAERARRGIQGYSYSPDTTVCL